METIAGELLINIKVGRKLNQLTTVLAFLSIIICLR